MQYYKANLGEKDMQFIIDAANIIFRNRKCLKRIPLWVSASLSLVRRHWQVGVFRCCFFRRCFRQSTYRNKHAFGYILGAQGVLRESDLTEDIVARTARRLEAQGARVHTTRIEPVQATPPGRLANLNARAESANRAGASLLIDIHLNAGYPGARGFMFFIPAPKEQHTNFRPERTYVLFNEKKHTPFDDPRQEASLELARILHKSFADAACGPNPIPPYRGGTIHISEFVVIGKANMPAVLVECGFMSTPADMNHLASAEYRENLAGRLTDAVRAYIEGASKN